MSIRHQTVSAPRRNRRGSAAIEFALWLPVLLLFVSAVVDYGTYMNQRVMVARAAMEGARVGAAVFEPTSVTAGSSSVPKAQARAGLVLTEMGIPCPGTGCSVAATYCQDGAAGVCEAPPFDGIVVNVTYAFDPPVGLIPVPAVVDETFMMAVENQRQE